MANLLSPKQLKIRRSEYTNVVLTGAFMVISVATFIAVLALLPAYILIRVDRVSLESQNQAIAESVSAAQGNSDRDQLIEARKRIEAINGALEESNMASLIMRALVERRPNGLRIQSVQFTSREKDTVRISGTMESRAQMQRYADSLSSDSLFESVSVPVSALADADDGIFVITTVGNSNL